LLGEFRCPGVEAFTVAVLLLRCLLVATVDLFKSYGLKRISLPAELAGDFGTAGRGEGPTTKTFNLIRHKGLIKYEINTKESVNILRNQTDLVGENLHSVRLAAPRDFPRRTLAAFAG